MCLNDELYKLLYATENEYGFEPEHWPPSRLREIQKAANRESEQTEPRQAVWLIKRGFTNKYIREKLRHRNQWVADRRPALPVYSLTVGDAAELAEQLKTGSTIPEIAKRMQRRQDWVSQMKERL